MKNKYDVVIKAHPKDYYKLDLVIETFHFLNPLPDKIYILSPDGYYPEGTSFDDKIIYITDDQVEPFIDRTRLTHRPNWNWINLVSILQKFTENDLYLDVQSDNFFVKPIDLFDESGRPRIFQNSYNDINNEGHRPYFVFQERVFDIPKANKGYSYIIEFMLYDRKKLAKLMDGYKDVDDLLETCCTRVKTVILQIKRFMEIYLRSIFPMTMNLFPTFPFIIKDITYRLQEKNSLLT